MISYFISFSVFLTVFWGVYFVSFRKETFFTYNRIYLLIVPIISAILPFLRMSIFNVYTIVQEKMIFLSPILVNKTSENTSNTSESVTGLVSFFEIYGIVLLYSLGVCIALLLWLKRYRSLQKMKATSIIERHTGYCIATVKNSTIACTFFETVFLGDRLSAKEKEQILAHELTHVRQKHSIDLLFFEILKAVFWFHPVVYRLQRELLEVHEFIADAQAVKKSDKNTYYQELLNYAFGTKNLRYVNQFFNQSFIKKRILMLHKSKSKSVLKLKYLVIIPLLMAMLVYVSCTEEASENQHIENPRETTSSTKEKRETFANEAVPFAKLDKAPNYPGCGDLEDNQAIKNCFSEKVKTFVNTHFDVEKVKPFAKEKQNRVYVRFTISKTGKVIDIQARAASPELAQEAKRVVNNLPAMQPGMQAGEPVSVLYTLPIIFQIDE